MKSDSIILLCDVDNTINLFSTAFKKMAEKTYGVEVDPTVQYTFEMSDTIVSDISPLVKNQIVRAIFKRDDFWKSIRPIPFAVKTLYQIKEEFGCKIVFATTPYTSNKNNESIKLDWLRKNIPFEYKVIFSDAKWKLEGDIIIDDKPETLEMCQGKMLTVKPLMPYNKDVYTNLTISKSWAQGDGLKLIKYIHKMFD